ncbi:uncharacterized protein TrAFT101_010195 [Trichoderma asperellum]|uniref:uncharacterized protein n=1 Tax=Trichoderma asperellum TaxID=101201 RepID=UPI003316A346|nr:hypothetical protein TrAFT101_010195 [Trichoderma asperellum]
MYLYGGYGVPSAVDGSPVPCDTRMFQVAAGLHCADTKYQITCCNTTAPAASPVIFGTLEVGCPVSAAALSALTLLAQGRLQR